MCYLPMPDVVQGKKKKGCKMSKGRLLLITKKKMKKEKILFPQNSLEDVIENIHSMLDYLANESEPEIKSQASVLLELTDN